MLCPSLTGAIALNRSCPAVSQICILIAVPSFKVTFFVRKKAPTVDCCFAMKYPSINLSTRHVLPTPLSPNTTTLYSICVGSTINTKLRRESPGLFRSFKVKLILTVGFWNRTMGASASVAALVSPLEIVGLIHYLMISLFPPVFRCGWLVSSLVSLTTYQCSCFQFFLFQSGTRLHGGLQVNGYRSQWTDIIGGI